MRVTLSCLMVLFAGCAAAGGAVVNAAVNTAIAGTVSGVRRANGDCFTICNPGTTCNKSTGYCDPIPCRGQCRYDEKCQEDAFGGKCVPAKELPPVTP